jgi:hypothetical protein
MKSHVKPWPASRCGSRTRRYPYYFTRSEKQPAREFYLFQSFPQPEEEPRGTRGARGKTKRMENTNGYYYQGKVIDLIIPHEAEVLQQRI